MATFGYEVKYNTSNGNKEEVFITTNPNITLTKLQPGLEVTVTVTALGLGFKKKSAPVTTTFTVPAFSSSSTPTGQEIVLPEDPQGVTLEMTTGEQVILRWIAPKGINANSLIAIIRHAPETDGDDLRCSSGSIDLRAPDATSPSIDANAHTRKEAQPVRPSDPRQQKFDEKTVRFAEANVDETAVDRTVRPVMGQTPSQPVQRKEEASEDEANAVGEGADGDE